MRRIQYPATTFVKVPPFWGDGSSGDLVLTTDYEMDEIGLYQRIDIPTGVTLYTKGNPLFASEYIRLRGTINTRGNDASGATAGSASSGKMLGAGTAGSDIRGTIGNGLAISDATHFYSSPGGKGGNAGIYTGATPNDNGLYTLKRTMMRVMLYRFATLGMTDSTTLPYLSGMGGGSGARDSLLAIPGAGGGGGIDFVALCKVFDGLGGTIDTRGGSGGNASGTAGNAGGGGGGGAGNSAIYSSAIGSPSYLLSGGTGGTGYGSGATGSAGTNGEYIESQR